MDRDDDISASFEVEREVRSLCVGEGGGRIVLVLETFVYEWSPTMDGASLCPVKQTAGLAGGIRGEAVGSCRKPTMVGVHIVTRGVSCPSCSVGLRL